MFSDGDDAMFCQHPYVHGVCTKISNFGISAFFLPPKYIYTIVYTLQDKYVLQIPFDR